MPADFNQPLTSTLYTTYLATLKERDVDALTLCVSDPSNIPVGAIKYNRASDKFQEWNGSAWVDKVLSLAAGGTGGTTGATARTGLGLGSMAIQDANAVAIIGGSIGTAVNIDASRLASGLVPSARLGTGGAGAGAKFLTDAQTFVDPISVLPGSGMLWFNNSAPTGYLICDGSAVSRTTYSVLFGLIGTAYGVGDGSTTFNLPDLRQRFPLGKAASGTGNTLGATGGAIDHTHTGAAHTHTIASHTHTGPSHTHTISADGSHNHGGTTTSDGLHGHTFSTNTDTPSAVDSSGGTSAGFLVPTTGHTHHLSGSSDLNGTHSHTISSDGSHSHGGATGASGTGVTGGTSLTTDSTTPGAGGTNNPPFVVVNYIIKT